MWDYQRNSFVCFFCATHPHTLKAESFDINELIINIIYDIKTKNIQLQIGKVLARNVLLVLENIQVLVDLHFSRLYYFFPSLPQK